MATAYTGHSFDFDVSPMPVTGGVVTTGRISIDWTEEGKSGHLDATSADGVTFSGNFGYPRPESRYHAELQLYRAANGERLLFGRWWRTDEPEGAYWLFQLSPESE